MAIKEASSFRDPAGQVIINNGVFYRRVNACALTDYYTLIDSGLYGELIIEDLIIPHVETELGQDYTIILPQQIPFISYPYEWCFSMLKEAALTTLRCGLTALDYNMMLKDGSAYNIQWVDGKMQLIDTLSFMRYQDGMFWSGYQQFVEHFITPLLLMQYKDAYIANLLKTNVDGIPVNVASKLLPVKTWLNINIVRNVHLPARLMADKVGSVGYIPSKDDIQKIFTQLIDFTESLGYKPRSAWTEYDNEDSYMDKAKLSKHDIIYSMLRQMKCKTVLDIGANTGAYSYLAKSEGYQVIATDRDFDCVEMLYQDDRTVLPLVVDLCNPSPAVGWGNTERRSFLDRLNVDTIMALALLHHLCIGNNIPLGMVAELLSQHCRNLIIEFIPLEDKKAQILLGSKTIPPYSEDIFIQEFSKYFICERRELVEDSCRSIYLLKR